MSKTKTRSGLPIIQINTLKELVSVAEEKAGSGWFIVEVNSNSVRKRGLTLEYARSFLTAIGFSVETTLVMNNSTPFNTARKRISMKVDKRG